jgi:predicted nucleotidyltransferase
MKFGLTDTDISYIKQVIAGFSEIESALIFGSRAMGNFKAGSDIDICIKGKRVTFTTVASLKANLEEMGPMPYQVDVVAYDLVETIELKKHIDQFGILI